MDERYFSEKLAEWYVTNRRTLPWRHTREPYNIWLSEIILQQTRVAQGMPYYIRFVETFPDVFALARASEQDVLRVWQGLGYYSRARNLHRCAQYIADECDGKFPTSYSGLLQLPGVGPYTAAAIASICFDESVPVLDGNVFRVLSRTFGIDADIMSPKGRKAFLTIATRLIDNRDPAQHNQALMEFGALQCTPRTPECGTCPVNLSCFANQHNLQIQLPVKTKSKKPSKRFFYYFVIRNGDRLLMKKRIKQDIWQGLYDFVLVEKPRAIAAARLMKEQAWLPHLPSHSLKVSAPYKHQLTHQTIISRFILLDEAEARDMVEEPLEYYSIAEIQRLPKPVLISRFLSDYNFL